MDKSDSLKNIAAALITFHVKVDKVSKDATNPFFKNRYASLSNILDTITDSLNESGLTICQFPTGQHGLTTIIIHAESGEYISSCYEMQPTKNDPQGIGSCITYQRRYALCSALSLNVSDEDDDGNAASQDNTKQPEKKQAAPADDNKLWMNKGSKEYLAAVEKLQKGTTTIQKILQYYKLSKDVRANLEACTNDLIIEKALA